MAKDFDRIPTEELENLILEQAGLTELYRIDIYLEKKKSGLFIQLTQTTRDTDRNAIKSNLSWTENMMQIIKKREDDLREDNNRYNWRFRTEAEKILSPEIYMRIAESAKR